MFYYTYVLRNLVDKGLYVGWTPDLVERIKKHKAGKVKATNPRKPFELIFYEAFTSITDALNREKFLKSGWGRNHIKKALYNTLLNQK